MPDDKEILQCFLNLPCCSFKKEKEKRPKKCRKCSTVTSTLASDGNNHFCDSNAELCCLNLPDDMIEDKPMDLEYIKEKQDEDNDLHQSLTKHPTCYSRKNINDVNNILCYTKPGDNEANWKIVLSKDLILPTFRWYHQVTGHHGSNRLYQHIHQQYYGGFTFFSIENSVVLIGSCLKILQCSTYVHNKTGTLLLITLSPCYYCGVYFCHTMMLAAAGF